MSSKKGLKAAVIVIAIVAAACGFYYYISNSEKTAQMEAYLDKDTIFDGITVNGIDVSLLTEEEALEKVEQEAGIIPGAAVSVTVLDRGWRLLFDDADARYDFKTAVEEAYAVGRKGSIKERYKQVKNAEENGLDIQAQYSYDAEKAEKFAAKLKKEADTEKQDSVISREDGRFKITDEVIGITVDEALTTDAVCAVLNTGKPGKVEAVYAEDKPTVTKEENEKSTTLIGTYYTTFSTGYTNRNINLKVGCDYINGTLIQPGEEFSTAKGLKDQTYANGYRNAAVYANGKVEDGMGGGVCQISTTVYNAVIRAELKVTERKNHSLPVSYVPLGMDAAIADGYKDFKFVNDTEYPVFLEAYLDGNKLIVNIYGYEIHDEGRTVDFETVYINSIPKPAEKVTEDPELPEGTREVTYKGSIGHVVQTYKKVFENGKLISREFFNESRYRSVADEVTVGTKPADETTPADGTTPDTGITEPVIDPTAEPSVPTEPADGEDGGSETEPAFEPSTDPAEGNNNEGESGTEEATVPIIGIE